MNRFKKHVFLHIPKTAGTTLTTIIGRNYRASQLAPLYNPAQFTHDLETALADQKINMLYGHFAFDEALRNANFYVFTFLREPVARTVSNFIHLKNSTEPQHKEWMRNAKSFTDFLALKQAFNWQARHLSGQKFHADFGKDLPASLEMATENLERMNFVGITERFNESLLCLSTDLAWKKLRHKKQNVQQKNDEAAQLAYTYRDQILEQNQLDFALYELGKKLFENRLQQITSAERLAFKLKLLL